MIEPPLLGSRAQQGGEEHHPCDGKHHKGDGSIYHLGELREVTHRGCLPVEGQKPWFWIWLHTSLIKSAPSSLSSTRSDPLNDSVASRMIANRQFCMTSVGAWCKAVLKSAAVLMVAMIEPPLPVVHGVTVFGPFIHQALAVQLLAQCIDLDRCERSVFREVKAAGEVFPILYLTLGLTQAMQHCCQFTFVHWLFHVLSIIIELEEPRFRTLGL